MSKAKRGLVTRLRRLAAAVKSTFRGGLVWLRLLLVGIFAAVAFLIICVVEFLRELSNLSIRSVDS